MLRSIIISTLVIGAAVVWFWLWYSNPGPPLDPEEWWGPVEAKELRDVTVRPFQVEFSEEMILDLKRRLTNSRAPPPPLEGVAFQYGFNSQELDHWRHFWAEKYNFTERERFFNQFPQFKTNIQGLDVHFIRVQPKVIPGVQTVPLLALHGWPGSVREFYELIPLLTRNPKSDFQFEVIVPSLPGFGFSDAAVRPGLGGPQIAIILRKLMQRIGHEQFYVHAGDWGAEIASDLSTLYPGAVLGYHTNLPIVKHPFALALTAFGAMFPSWLVDEDLVDRMNPLPFLAGEGGYFYLQATKPDTISIVLSDSPVGLLAYILEKFSAGTNPQYMERPDGGLLEKFSREQLLDNLMMYWVGGAGTAARLYADGLSQVWRRWRLNIQPTPVPTWVLQAKHEILYQTPTAIRCKFPNLLNVSVLQLGGHFIALEEPQILANDLFTSVKAFREFHKSKAQEEVGT